MKHTKLFCGSLSLGISLVSVSRAEDNTTTTFSSGGSTNIGGPLIIGSTGVNNTLLISNATAVTSAYGIIGDAATANFNSGLVTGSGSAWYNTDPSGIDGLSSLFVGNNGSSNTLVISNGGVLDNNGRRTMIGYASSSIGNSVTVTGNGSLWTNVFVLSIGQGGGNNRLTVTNGGQVDVSHLWVGNLGAAGNSLVIDGANSLVNVHSAFAMGPTSSSDNQTIIQNGGRLISTSGNLQSSRNQMIVTGPGSTWSNRVNGGTGGVTIGATGSGNSLILTNGGTANGEVAFNIIGSGAAASNNYMVVSGPGSSFDNRHGMIVGNSGSSNSLLIANGGIVLLNRFSDSTHGLIIGANSGSANNLVKIDGGNLIVTNSGGTTFMDVRRGKLEFNSGHIDTDRLYATNGSGSVVEFNGGTLVTRGTTINNGSAFTVGNGSSAATLRLKGGTHSFADGLTVNTAARLEGNGTIQGNTTVDGTLAPGESPGQVQFVGNLTLSSTSDYEVELNGTTAGTLYDQADVMGGVSLGGGALSVSLGYSANTGDQYTIINNDLIDPVSGTFGGLPEGSSLFVSGINEFKISYMGGDGNDVVLTFLVPEPSAAALLGIGGLLLRRRRKRAAE